MARFAERAKELPEEKQIKVIENLKSAVCLNNTNFAHRLLITDGKIHIISDAPHMLHIRKFCSKILFENFVRKF